jgi:hypothetical protein
MRLSPRGPTRTSAVMQSDIAGMIPRAKLGPSWVTDSDKPTSAPGCPYACQVGRQTDQLWSTLRIPMDPSTSTAATTCESPAPAQCLERMIRMPDEVSPWATPCRFYQHIEDSSGWAWRMCWGHASSEDLVRWVREPMALRPTPGAAHPGVDPTCCLRRRMVAAQSHLAVQLALMQSAMSQVEQTRAAAGPGAAQWTSMVSQPSYTQESGLPPLQTSMADLRMQVHKYMHVV